MPLKVTACKICGHLEVEKAKTGLWGQGEPVGLKSNLFHELKGMLIRSGSIKMKQMMCCPHDREKQIVISVMLLNSFII